MQGPEARGRDAAGDDIVAGAAQRLARRVARGDELRAFGGAERQLALAREAGLGIGVGLRRPLGRIDAPLADRQCAEILDLLHHQPDAARAAAKGDGERKHDEENGFQHGRNVVQKGREFRWREIRHAGTYTTRQKNHANVKVPRAFRAVGQPDDRRLAEGVGHVGLLLSSLGEGRLLYAGRA